MEGEELRITIKDLASMCGVSAGTVDRALNNRKGISEKTRKKILRVAKEMDYRPDYTARSLVMGKTMTLGVVLFDLYNRSFAQLMNAIETRARELGYFVYLTLTAKNPENEVKCIDNLVNRKVDGIILLTVNKGEAFEAYLERLRIPLVTIFNFISDRWEHIGIQERNAMKGAIDYIVSKQYHNYIYVSPPLAYIDQSNIYTQEERLNGFLEGLEANRIDRPTEIIRDKDYVTVLEQTRFSENEKNGDCMFLRFVCFRSDKSVQEKRVAHPESNRDHGL